MAQPSQITTYPSRIYDSGSKTFVENINREQSSDTLTTVAVKKTNEMLGFPDGMSVDEIEHAINGDLNGTISQYKPSFYERTFRDPLAKLGMDMFQPKFISEVKPTPERAFATGLARGASADIIKPNFSDQEQQANPYPYLAGNLVGSIGGLNVVGKLLQATRLPSFIKYSSEVVGNLASKAGATGKVATITAKAAGATLHSAAVAGTYRAIAETSDQIRDKENPDLAKIGQAVLHDTLWWGAIGGIQGSIASKAIGVSTAGGLGYIMGKADGASESDALLNGGILAGFHIFSSNPNDPKTRKTVVDHTQKMVSDYLLAKNPLMDEQVSLQSSKELIIKHAEDILNEKVQLNTAGKRVDGLPITVGEVKNPVEEVLKSPEATKELLERVSGEVFAYEPPQDVPREKTDETVKIPEFTGNNSTDAYAKEISGNPGKIKALEDHVVNLKSERDLLQKEDAQDKKINPEREKKIGNLASQISLANDALKSAKKIADDSSNQNKSLESANKKLKNIDQFQTSRDYFEKKGDVDKVARMDELIKKNELTPEEENALISDITGEKPLTQEVNKVPFFKNSEEAIAFGEANKDNPEIMAELSKLKEEYEAKARSLMGKNASDADLDIAFEEAIKGQLFNEAIKSAQGKINKTNLSDGTEVRGIEGETKQSLELRTDETKLEDRSRERDIQVAKTPSDLVKKISQLNKFAQSIAVLRKAGGVSGHKRAVGLFVPPGKSKRASEVSSRGEVRVKKDYAAGSNFNYMSVLAHELGHSLEFNLLGKIGRNTWEVFGKNVPTEDLVKIRKELMNITIELEGKTAVDQNPAYYKQSAELFARFLQKMFESPGNLMEIAPTAMKYFEAQAEKHSIIADFLEAAKGEIDKGQSSFVPLRDLKETYQKVLGKKVGTLAYNDEVIHAALQARGTIEIEKLIKEKFKNVKDDPALLFDAAESIKNTINDEPQFGTRDFVKAKNLEEEALYMSHGYKVESLGELDGKVVTIMAKWRYTPEQGKEIFQKLSPEGQELIKDFTLQREEAKDFFNRELIKDAYKIEGNIEGWVHHFFEDTNVSEFGKGKRIKQKKNSAAMKREGVAGFTKDLQKAMHKMLVESESVKVYNDFIERWFARVSKPLIEDKPDEGWVEVQGSVKKGIGTAQETRTVIIKDGEAFVPKKIKYQVPAEIYKRYELFKGVVTEASAVHKFINDVNRYWRINILFHPGSSATNFISGGIQFSDKIMTDFYRDLLTGDISMAQTKRNVNAMINVFMPKGWAKAPDWIYGGDMSNFYGQFIEKEGVVGKGIDKYADNVLKLYGAVERYWKKVLVISEGGSNLEKLGKMTKEGLKLPDKEEREILANINDAVDLYAYNYNNVPTWLQEYNRGTVGKAVKPFLTYPYKYMKQVMTDIGIVFDRTLPWQERTAKLMALTTMFGALTYLMNEQKKKQHVPAGTEKTPASVSPRGRMYISTDKNGKDVFVRVAKYPFFNLTSAGSALVDGRFQDATDAMSDTIGSVGPMGQIGLLAMGYKNKYNQYDKAPVILGNSINTFIPGYRILDDISRYFDPFQRKQESFGQTFTKLIPTTDEDLQKKLHGDIRTIRVPAEGKFNDKSEGKRTTFDRQVMNFKEDILLSFLTGIYQTRIDPKEAEAFQERQDKNKLKADRKAKNKKEN